MALSDRDHWRDLAGYRTLFGGTYRDRVKERAQTAPHTTWRPPWTLRTWNVTDDDDALPEDLRGVLRTANHAASGQADASAST